LFHFYPITSALLKLLYMKYHCDSLQVNFVMTFPRNFTFQEEKLQERLKFTALHSTLLPFVGVMFLEITLIW